MKAKKKFGMGVKKGTKIKGKTRKSKVKSFSNVIQTGIRALKTLNRLRLGVKQSINQLVKIQKKLRFPVLLMYRKLVVFYLLYPF